MTMSKLIKCRHSDDSFPQTECRYQDTTFYTQEVEMKYSCVHICNQDTEHFYFEIGMYGHQQRQHQSSEVRKEVKIDLCPDTR